MKGNLRKQNRPQILVSCDWAQTNGSESRASWGGAGSQQAEGAWAWPQVWKGGAQCAVKSKEPLPPFSWHALFKGTPYRFNQMLAFSYACHTSTSSSASLPLQFEYKLDREFLKGCKLSVTDDKDMVLALRNSLIESDVSIQSLTPNLAQGCLQQHSPQGHPGKDRGGLLL